MITTKEQWKFYSFINKIWRSKLRQEIKQKLKVLTAMNVFFSNIKVPTFLYVLITGLLCFSNLAAQPGWKDFTQRYFYRILDKSGKEISFKSNKDYYVMIDSVAYRWPNTPQEPLKNAIFNDPHFSNQILINDFSLSIPTEDYYSKGTRLEIKIIFKKDTMFLCQATGIGSKSLNWESLKSSSGKKKELLNYDFTLSFSAGHYYFPIWAITLETQLPLTTGKVKFQNFHHQHYIVPKEIYDLIPYRAYKQQGVEKADSCVAENFKKGNYEVRIKREPTKFISDISYYKNRGWSPVFHPTKKTNLFYYMMYFSADYGNCYSGKYIFSTINIDDNTITHFLPRKNPRLVGSEKLYIDTNKNILYLPVWVMQEFDEKLSDCQVNQTPKKQIYYSADDGNSWNDSKLADLPSNLSEGKFEQPLMPPSPFKKMNDSTTEYQNFYLRNNSVLVFKNGTGSLTLNKNAIAYPYSSGINNNYLIVEKDSQIYLIDGSNPGFNYLSFNGGRTWYIHPLSSNSNNYYYQLLRINANYEISFFIDEWTGEHGFKTYKQTYKFSTNKKDN